MALLRVNDPATGEAADIVPVVVDVAPNDVTGDVEVWADVVGKDVDSTNLRLTRAEAAELRDRLDFLLGGTAARDRRALDALAVGLGTTFEWGSDELEWIAEAIGTARPHPGDSADDYVERFEAETGRPAPAAFVRERD